MAGSLEFGKLISTSFLFRYWEKSKIFLRIYLISAIVILILITSSGTFGYLTGAYQQSSIENKIIQDKITIIEDQKKYSQDKIQTSKKRIDNITIIRNSQESRLNESLTNSLISRNPIQLRQIQQQTSDFIEESQRDIENENQKIQKSINELQSFDNQISELKTQNNKKKDIQTFKFIADEFGVELNKVAKWFIFILIIVFDPLSVCLWLAYNTIIQSKESTNKQVENSENTKEPKQTEKEVIKEIIKEVPLEKEIIKEIIKEVPVEKEIIKEIIKEVPVEKEVIKELPVEKEIVKQPTRQNYFSF
jgi:hypothetical protein